MKAGFGISLLLNIFLSLGAVKKNTVLPSIGGIIIADYYMVRRGHYTRLEDTCFQQIRPTAVIAWLAGVLAARYIPGIAPVNSVLCSMGVYLVTEQLAAGFKRADIAAKPSQSGPW